MNIIAEKIQGLKNFFGEVAMEMKKSSWPGRQELLQSTMVVIVSVILLALFIGISDKVLIVLLRILIPASG